MGKNDKKKTDNRRRVRLPIWLDLNKPTEADIADEVAYLKNNRQFAATARDALRLILSLRAGRLDVLEELFPTIITKIEARMLPDPDDINNKLEELKRLIEQGKVIPMFGNDNGMKLAQVGEKLPGLKPVMKPTFEDDDSSLIVLEKDTSTTASDNFLKSMMGLQQ